MSRYLGLRDSSQQVRPYVVRFGRRGVIGVAADVEVVVFLRQFVVTYHGGEAGDVLVAIVGADDLLDMLGVQVILRPAFPVFGVSIDEEHLATPLGGLGVFGSNHKDAGGDARAIEDVGGHADDGVEQIVPDETGPNLLLRSSTEQDTMRHDGADHAAGPKYADHVLDEHQVSLLAALRAEAVGETLREWDAFRRVVLRERRIGDDPVEPHQLAALLVEWVGEGVSVLQLGVGDVVQDHVHLGNGPGGAVVLLAVEREIPRVAPVFPDVLVRQDEHTA